MSSEGAISAWAEIAGAVRSLGRRPFLVLLLLGYLLALVAMSISSHVDASSSDPALSVVRDTSNLIVEVIGIYLQIAVVLVAGGTAAEPDADPWIRAAFKHRCFWRFFAVTILEVLLALIGGVALLVGAAVVGGIIGLGQPAVVLERLQPIAALRRSAALTKTARRPVGIVFFVLLLLPAAVGIAFLAFDVRLDGIVDAAFTMFGSTTSFIATVTLTRIFVKLGGAPTPPM